MDKCMYEEINAAHAGLPPSMIAAVEMQNGWRVLALFRSGALAQVKFFNFTSLLEEKEHLAYPTATHICFKYK